MAELSGYIAVQKKFKTGIMVAQAETNQSQENLIQYGKVGSPLWTERTGIDLRYATANQTPYSLDNTYGKVGSKAWSKLTGINVEMATANQTPYSNANHWSNTSGEGSITRSMNHADAIRMNKLNVEKNERELKSNDSKALVSSVVTDASTGKNAVTVIQHLHMDGSPTIRTLIHDYHTSSEYGMGPSMFGFNQ
jgi:hypothetical protein